MVNIECDITPAAISKIITTTTITTTTNTNTIAITAAALYFPYVLSFFFFLFLHLYLRLLLLILIFSRFHNSTDIIYLSLLLLHKLGSLAYVYQFSVHVYI